MDTNVAGLNKLTCKSDSSHNGRAVVVTDGINTWSGTIANITGVGYACIFMIPSMPAPAKKSFTVKLKNAAGTADEYTKAFELGFGDSLIIELATGKEVANKDYVASEITSHAYSLPTAATNTKGGVKVPSSATGTNGVYMSGESLVTAKAAASQLGCVKIGTGINVNSSDGTISLEQADGSNLGGVKIGTGLQIDSSTGVSSVKAGEGIGVNSNGVYIKAAGASAATKGGVYVQSGKGLQLDSDGELYVKNGNGINRNSNGISVNPGVGISVSSEGVNLKTLSRYTLSRSSLSETVEANSNKKITVTVSSNSTEGVRLSRGFVQGASCNYGNLICVIEDVYYGTNGTKIEVRVHNTSNISFTITFLDIYYSCFE